MLTVAMGAGSIEIYTFSGDVDTLNTRDTSSSSSSSPSGASTSTPAFAPFVSLAARRLATRVAVLLLPPTHPGQDVRRALTHSGPFVARATPGRPFETSEDVRVHMLTLHYGDRAGMFIMFVLNRFLLSLVPPGASSQGDYPHVVKPWEEWGPENTRVFEWMAHFPWLRCVARTLSPHCLTDACGAGMYTGLVWSSRPSWREARSPTI